MTNEEEKLETNTSSSTEQDPPEEQPSHSGEDNESTPDDMGDMTMQEETVPPETCDASSLDLQVEDKEEEENVGHGNKQYNHTDNDQSPPPLAAQQQSTQAPGMIQVSALLRKNFLTKLRTPVATFFELFSPLLMMLILSAAYTLSDVQYRDAATYYSLTVDIPGPWFDLAAPALDLLTGGEGIAGLTQRKRILSSPISESDMDEQSSTLKEDLLKMKSPQWMDEASRQLMRQVQELTSVVPDRKLQESVESTGNETSTPGDETGVDDFSANFDLLNDAIRQVRSVLESPVNIPSFETFVGLSETISQVVGVDDLPQIFTDSSFGRQWGNLLTLGTIHISPSNAFAQEFGNYLAETYPLLFTGESVTVRYHNTEGDALSYIDQNLNERAWALLDFEDCSFEEDIYGFKIRQNYTTLPNTNQLVDYTSIGLNGGYQLYYLSGFLTLQRTINEFIFSQNECSGDFSNVWSMPMPTAAYAQNPFFQQVGFLLGLTFVMAFLFPTSRLVKSLVEEKETRMRETLFILGLRQWAHWTSWFTSSFLAFLIITTTMTLSLVNTVLQFSNPWFIFAYILLFSLSTIGVCFMLSSLFTRAKLAAILSPIVLFGTILPRFIFFGVNRYEATSGLIAASLFPATAFALGADIIAAYEYAETGVQTFNVQEGKYSFQTCLIMLSVDTVLYLLLAIYFEKVIPRQYGSPEPFYFFLTPKFWCGLFGKSNSDVDLSSIDGENETGNDPNVEAVDPKTFVPRVVVSDLVKQYSKAIQPAVDHLNMCLYEDQITCLLGHNGAGKSSTISCITGLFPPTSGDCSIYGNSIVSSSQEARASIGYCPQHNTLFSLLTVKEHLELFMRLRGIQPTDEMLSLRAGEIGLADFLSIRSTSLSGGNKRKLSVAIALCADPKVLVLDEPTSSMDPHSRRAVWQLLRQKRKGRVTLFTSHFMDESEVLSDRIAVLKKGKLQCVGSAGFLKQRFGLGYNLTVVSNSSEQVFQLNSLVKSVIPGTSQLRQSGKESVFRIPRGEERKLPALCDAMDTARDFVSAYGVQNSSLEEVFLRLAESEDFDEERQESQEGNSDKLSKGDEETAFASVDHDSAGKSGGVADMPDEENKLQEILKNSSPLSSSQQIGLLYWKRVVTQRRDRCGFVFLVVVPTIVIAMVLAVLMINPRFVGPGIELTPDLYSVVVGEASETGVIFGGDSNFSDFEFLSNSLSDQYPFMQFERIPNSTSTDISQFLLENIAEQDFPPRFGSFVQNDEIRLRVNVNWDRLSQEIEDLLPEPFVDLLLLFQTVNESADSSSDPEINGAVNNTLADATVLLQTLQSEACDSEFLEQLNTFVPSLVSSSNLIAQDTIRQSMNDTVDLNPTETTPELDQFLANLPLPIVNNSLLEELTVSFEDMNTTEAQLDFALIATESLSNSFLESFFSNNNEVENAAESICSTWSSLSGPLSGATISTSDEDISNVSGTFDEFLEAVPMTGVDELIVSFPSNMSILHNSSSPHAVAAFNQAYVNFLHTSTCNASSGSNIITVNQPLPLTSPQEAEILVILSILASLFLLIPLGYVPGAFLPYIVRERRSKCKHLQLCSGVSVTSYWIATYAFDMTLFFLLTVLVMIVFLCYGAKSAEVFVGDVESFFATTTVLLGYGSSIIPFTYLIGRTSTNPSSAQVAAYGVLFITGFVAVNAYFIMDSISTTKAVAAALLPLFRMWPGFNLGEAFINLSIAFFERKVIQLSDGANRPFDWDVCGKTITLLFGLAPVYFLLLLLLEFSGDGGSGGWLGQQLRSLRYLVSNYRLRNLTVGEGEVGIDEDVLAEKEAISASKFPLTATPVLIQNLWKVFPPPFGFTRRNPRFAVKDLSLAVQQGEVLGLLGENGAGKTTTLSMLTNDIDPTIGQAFVCGNNVATDVAAARKRIGLCPQVDPLLDMMTCRETLKMFARLRGIPRAAINDVVETLLVRLTLTPHADKVSSSLSGGNKRKLSLGVASLVGNGGVLLIDEASSGLDPLARRKLWDLIQSLSADRSAIITTHSMEEAEALCSRVGIMAHGRLVAINSVQRLKSRFMDGYTVSMNLASDTAEDIIDAIVSSVLTSVLPGSKVAERHGPFLTFEVPRISDVGLGTCFQRLEELQQNEACVLGYSVSQCSLEQVFIKLVKEADAIEFGHDGEGGSAVVDEEAQL